MKRFFTSILLVFTAVSAFPQVHLFEDAFNSVKDKQNVFKTGADWFPYPPYENRQAWDELTAPFKENIFKLADKYLDYKWEIFKASAYLEYEKTGNRKLALCEEHNREAIEALTLGELCDGTGKYLPQLIDGLCFMSRQFSWAHFQHTGYQKSHRTLPSEEEFVISLHNASTASCIAIAYHFFKPSFDKIDPSIAQTIYDAVDRQILTPFFSEEQDAGSHRIWTGFKKKEGKKLNNWTPFCDQHVTATFLLMEKDADRLLRSLERSVKIMDFYMSDQHPDGACDEGPGYWGMSFAKVYDYARMMCDASGGRMNVFSDKLIRRMGEYKSKTYFPGGWTLSFGDCTPRDAGSPGKLFPFGYDTGSKELMNLAVYMLRNNKTQSFKPAGIGVGLGGTYNALEIMRYHPLMVKYEDRLFTILEGNYGNLVKWLREDVKNEYYPDTDYAIFRNGLWNLGCKGAHNGESHNHNDVGSAILIWDTMPVIYDPGTGKYVKETFSSKRYTIWTMQSKWHATPSPNGVEQKNGASYAARNSVCRTGASFFSTDISGAYPEGAKCTKWVREYKLSEYNCKITDTYALSGRSAEDQINFPIRGEVALPGETLGNLRAGDGEVLIKVRTFEGGRSGLVRLKFSSNLTPCKEVKKITDGRLKRNAGPSLTRLYFKSAPDAPLQGKYTFEFAQAQ